MLHHRPSTIRAVETNGILVVVCASMDEPPIVAGERARELALELARRPRTGIPADLIAETRQRAWTRVTGCKFDVGGVSQSPTPTLTLTLTHPRCGNISNTVSD